jgi:predicted TIM-barrel fold metal-dependent hydrolase
MTPMIVDGDSHFLEPLDLWEKYIESKYRDKAMRFIKDRKTGEMIAYEVEGRKRAEFSPEIFREAVGFEDPKRMADPNFSADYANAPAGALDPAARMKWLDAEGINKQLVYPTWGLMWEADVDDPEVAAAYCRAYNTWVWEVCQPYSRRLYPVAHISLRDVEEAVKEIRRVAKLGFKGAFVGSRPLGGRSFGHPFYDQIWAEAQEMDLAVGIHLTGNYDYVGSAWYKDSALNSYLHFSMMVAEDPRKAMTTLMCDGALERFPRLKIGLVETKSGWVAEWLERFDHRFSYLGYTTGMKRKPSEYFQRQCWISADPVENTLPAMVGLVGEEPFLWGSDFPHAEGFINPVKETKERLRSLSARAQEKILGENAVRVFGL